MHKERKELRRKVLDMKEAMTSGQDQTQNLQLKNKLKEISMEVDILRVEVRVAGVDALRREREEEITAGFTPLGCEAGQDHFLGSAGISRALEHDQLAGLLVATDLFGSGIDEADVRVACLRERGRDADIYGVDAGQRAEIRSCTKAA